MKLSASMSKTGYSYTNLGLFYAQTAPERGSLRKRDQTRVGD